MIYAKNKPDSEFIITPGFFLFKKLNLTPSITHYIVYLLFSYILIKQDPGYKSSEVRSIPKGT